MTEIKRRTFYSHFGADSTMRRSAMVDFMQDCCTISRNEDAVIGPMMKSGEALLYVAYRQVDILSQPKYREELTVRTHQLNSTGYTYSFSELRELMTRPDWIFRVAALEDDYGDSGKVGIMLLKRQEGELVLKLLIVSCRVMSRGVGSALLAYATILAAREGRALLAEFRETEYNRIMYITYKLAGFEEQSEAGDKLLLRYGESEPLTLPDYLDFREA